MPVSQEKPRSRPIDVSQVTPFASWIPFLGMICLGCGTLAIIVSATSVTCFEYKEKIKTQLKGRTIATQRKSCRQWWWFLLCLSVILAFSFMCGAATMRKRVVLDSDQFMLNDLTQLTPYGNKQITFNHRETDELIFETLTATISKNIWDYSLQSSGIIDTFRLSKENYDDDIFIHPPFFVYSLYAMLHWFGIPLMMASVCFHTLTAALVAPLTVSLLSVLLPATHSSPSSSPSPPSYSSALWATLLFIMCPVARLSSQKIWIDNAAVFTATLSASVHIYLLRNSRHLTRNSISLRSLLSGFFYGLIALNCKITSLAMVPFLFSWICLVTVCSDHPHAAASLVSKFGNGIMNCSYFLIGALCGHGPWVYLYYVSEHRRL